MDNPLEVYNIIEPYSTDDDDVCTYLYSRNIHFEMRSATDLEEEIDFNWMAITKAKSFITYIVRLDPDEVLIIKLKFPKVRIKKPNPPEKVSTFARRVAGGIVYESKE